MLKQNQSLIDLDFVVAQLFECTVTCFSFRVLLDLFGLSSWTANEWSVVLILLTRVYLKSLFDIGSRWKGFEVIFFFYFARRVKGFLSLSLMLWENVWRVSCSPFLKYAKLCYMYLTCIYLDSPSLGYMPCRLNTKSTTMVLFL